ncbi:MAG: hypothetical protein AAF633_06500, partial [Chloroflexota bacterium]
TGQQIYKTTIALNQHGIALFRYQIADEGEYSVVVTPERDTVSATCTFSCAAFSLSPFLATLRSYTLNDDILSADIELKSASIPYSGPVTVNILMRRRVITTNTIEVQNGRLALKEKLGQLYSDHAELKINLSSTEGHTASLTLQNVSGSTRDQVNIAKMPSHFFKGALSPQKLEDKPLRGLYLQQETLKDKFPYGHPWTLREIVTEAGHLTVHASIKKLLIQRISPTGKRFENLIYRDLDPGAEIELPPLAAQPHQFFAFAAIFQDSERPPYESYAHLIAPQRLSCTLSGPEVVKPGTLVELELSSSRPATAVILVYDARLEHESPLPKLNKSTFEYLKSFSSQAQATEAKTISKEISQGSYFHLNLQHVWDERQYRSMRGGLDMLMLESAGLPQPMARIGSVFQGEMLGGAVEAMPALEMATRESFPEVIHCELIIEVGQLHRQVIKVGDQIGTWRCKAYLFNGSDWVEVSHDISAELNLYTELDVPAIAGDQDRVWGKAIYHTQEPATLTITTSGSEVSHQVQGDGLIEFPISGPGEILTDIRTEFDRDKGLRVIPPPGRETVTASRLVRLNPGESISANRIVAYPSESELLAETIQALIRYPFG